MMMIDGLKQDIEYDLIEHDGNGTCASILGIGLFAAAAAVGIASIAMWNNPFCWLGLNFKKFTTAFVIADAAVSTAGVIVTKGVSASMKDNDTVTDEEYAEFESMLNKDRHIEVNSNTSHTEREPAFVS